MMSAVYNKCLTLSNGRKMPQIGLGTWKTVPGDVATAVKEAIRQGYRHLDCAYVYGNEEEIGSALQEVFAEGKVKREDLFIVTKLWNTRHRPEDVKVSLQGQLKNLQLDYIDMYLIHWPFAFQRNKGLLPRDAEGSVLFDTVPFVDTWKAMEELVYEGLAQGIGISNFNSKQIQDIIDNCRIRPAVIQVEVHPYFTQEKLLNFCSERNLAVTGYSPLGSNARGWGESHERNSLEDPVIAKLAAKYNKTPAQVILRWHVQRNIIVVPKSATPSRIKENIELADFELTPDEMTSILSLNRNQRMFGTYDQPSSPFKGFDKLPNYPFLIEF